MLPWKLQKSHILPVHQNLSSVYFSLAKFQLVSCNLSLAMIWQMTYTHKLPKLCSATLSTSGLFHKKNSPHGKESKTVLDSGFHAVNSGFQVLHFSLCQWNQETFMAWWNLDSGFLEVYSKFPCPGFAVPCSKFARGTNWPIVVSSRSRRALTSYTWSAFNTFYGDSTINKGDSCYECNWNQRQTSPGY